MSTRARAAGAVGTIVSGRFRDIDGQRGLNYSVGSFWLKSTICPFATLTPTMNCLKFVISAQVFASDVGIASPYGAVKVSAVSMPVKLYTCSCCCWKKMHDLGHALLELLMARLLLGPLLLHLLQSLMDLEKALGLTIRGRERLLYCDL
jgi:hypothetical protein